MYIYTCLFHIFQKEPVLDAKKIRLAGGATGARHLVQCHGAMEQLSRGAESWLGEPHARGDDATEAEKITVS